MCAPPQIYAGPLEGSARAVVLLNLHTIWGQYLVSNLTVTWEQLGLPEGAAATVRDLYAEKDLGVFTGSFTAEVLAHDVVVVRITLLEGLESDSWRPWHQQPMYAEVAGASGAKGVEREASGAARGGAGRKVAPGSAVQQGLFARQ